MGIDYGEKRIGIALSDDEGTMAFPRSVIQNDKRAIEIIIALVKSEKVESIVVGESKNNNGEKNTIFDASKVFAEKLSDITGIPFLFEPELYTSAEAERLQGKNDMLDASAAAIILKSYLDKKQNA